jgi:hypothetical protein
MTENTEYEKGFAAGKEDYPDSSVYETITPHDIITDEWNRGYVCGFNQAKNEKSK